MSGDDEEETKQINYLLPSCLGIAATFNVLLLMERGRGPGQEVLYLRDQMQPRTAPVLCRGGDSTGKVGSPSSLAGAAEGGGNGKLKEASLPRSVSVKVTAFCVRAPGGVPFVRGGW